jgi:hypothetical protein
LRTRSVLTAAVTAGALAALVPAASAQAAGYSSALKVRGIQYDAPGGDANNCSTGNTDEEYLAIRNYSSAATVNLKGYVVKDAAGNRFAFTANHYLQPSDSIKLRGGRGIEGHGGVPRLGHRLGGGGEDRRVCALISRVSRAS